MLNGPPGTIVWRPANCSHSSLSFVALGWQRMDGQGWQIRVKGILQGEGMKEKKETTAAQVRRKREKNRERGRERADARMKTYRKLSPPLPLVSSLVQCKGGAQLATRSGRNTISEGQRTIWNTWKCDQSWNGVFCAVACSADLFLVENKGLDTGDRHRNSRSQGLPWQSSLFGLDWYSYHSAMTGKE